MFLKKIAIVLAVILFYSIPSLAQERWQWPEHPQNIKVLPSDIKPQELRAAMHEFTEGLGVRCNYCHVGEEGKPFTEWDFKSDDKQTKQTAREMIRMVYDIDEHLAKITPSGDTRVNVMCYTCHHGRPRPMTLGEEINEAYRKGGLEPAITHLSELKKEYYGKGVYNFESAEVLSDFGNTLLDSSKTDQALRIFKLNVERFPESSYAWVSLADAYSKSGNKEAAIKSCEKAIELDPGNRYAKRMLENLKK